MDTQCARPPRPSDVTKTDACWIWAVVHEDEITSQDAGRAGFASRDELLAELNERHEGKLYRIALCLAGADPRIESDDSNRTPRPAVGHQLWFAESVVSSIACVRWKRVAYFRVVATAIPNVHRALPV